MWGFWRPFPDRQAGNSSVVSCTSFMGNGQNAFVVGYGWIPTLAHFGKSLTRPPACEAVPSPMPSRKNIRVPDRPIALVTLLLKYFVYARCQAGAGNKYIGT